MKNYGIGILLNLGWILILTGCLNNSDELSNPLLISTSVFTEDAEGWEAQFSEYEPGLENSLKLSFTHDKFMATESIGEVTAVVQSGYAANSDLFMYIKRQISGFKPNTSYSVVFTLELFAQLNEDFSGDLSDNNNGSFLKAAVYTEEPDTLTVDDIVNPGKKIVITNFNKGDDRTTGPNMALIGKLEHTSVDESPLLLIGTSEGDDLLGTTDNDGKMWMMIGVDTNQPIYQSIFYSFIGIQFREI
jgi:hypothetical protein